MALARKVDRRTLKRERKMDVAKSHASIVDTVPVSTEGNIRSLVRSNRSANVYDSVATNDAIATGAASIADIDRLMAELQAARDYLQAEGERVRQINANYAHLAQTASASASVISESIGKWRIPEQASGHQPPTAVGPSMSPDVETLAGTFSEVRPALEKMEQELAQMSAIQAAVRR
jgi:chromosome segregation ATPase